MLLRKITILFIHLLDQGFGFGNVIVSLSILQPVLFISLYSADMLGPW